MESLLDVLAKIEEDPVRFLGNPSCEKLWSFVVGWHIATPVAMGPQDDSFRLWLHEKYAFPDQFRNEFIIPQLAAGNDHDAFFLYFKELGIYRKVNPSYFEPQSICGGPVHAICERQEMIERITKKPGMYIGAKRADRFRAYLDGDAYARRQSDPSIQLYADLDKLEAWLAKEEGFEKPVRCEVLALAYSMQNEDNAFDWLASKIAEFESLSPVAH